MGDGLSTTSLSDENEKNSEPYVVEDDEEVDELEMRD